MQEFEASVTEKGQVTIPREIRRIMGLQPHDKVRFEVEGGVVKISRSPSKLLQWYGSVTPRNKPENFQKIREVFENSVAQEVIAEISDNDRTRGPLPEV